MKYASVFATILFIWIAAIVSAVIVNNSSEIFQLYLSVIIMTVILFVIGFGKK
jgi:uncharacterized membrane protein YcaP (DUF421 family)